MSPERFEHLLSLAGPIISKNNTHLREAISAEQRLVITLRFLSSGDAQQSLSFSFRIGKTTVSNIISETCLAIYDQLKEMYMHAPKSEEEWLKIASTFEES